LRLSDRTGGGGRGDRKMKFKDGYNPSPEIEKGIFKTRRVR